MTIQHSHGLEPTRAGRCLVAAVAVAVLVPSPAAAIPSGPMADQPAGSSPAPKPATSPTYRLDVGVDDGRAATKEGDHLTYTVTLRNLGGTTVTGLRITLTVPSELRLRSADHGGRRNGGHVRWSVDLPGGHSAVLTAAGDVRPTPPQLLRLAAVACVTTEGADRPIVCATHSDELPAGARRAAASRPRDAAAETKDGGTAGLWYVVSGVLIFAVLLGVAVRLRRSRRATL